MKKIVVGARAIFIQSPHLQGEGTYVNQTIVRLTAYFNLDTARILELRATSLDYKFE